MLELYHHISLPDIDQTQVFIFKTLSSTPLYRITVDMEYISQLNEVSFTNTAQPISFKKAQVSITASETKPIYVTTSQAFLYIDADSQSAASAFTTNQAQAISETDAHQ